MSKWRLSLSAIWPPMLWQAPPMEIGPPQCATCRCTSAVEVGAMIWLTGTGFSSETSFTTSDSRAGAKRLENKLEPLASARLLNRKLRLCKLIMRCFATSRLLSSRYPSAETRSLTTLAMACAISARPNSSSPIAILGASPVSSNDGRSASALAKGFSHLFPGS